MLTVKYSNKKNPSRFGERRNLMTIFTEWVLLHECLRTHSYNLCIVTLYILFRTVSRH